MSPPLPPECLQVVGTFDTEVLSSHVSNSSKNGYTLYNYAMFHTFSPLNPFSPLKDNEVLLYSLYSALLVTWYKLTDDDGETRQDSCAFFPFLGSLWLWACVRCLSDGYLRERDPCPVIIIMIHRSVF